MNRRQSLPRRRGYTLVEMLAASISAGMIVAGLSSTLYISTQTVEMATEGGGRSVNADRVVSAMLGEAERALWFTERSATALEFYLADRDGDGLRDLVRYEWSGVAGAPLLRTTNGGSPVTLLRDVQRLEFNALTRDITPPDVTVAPPSRYPVVEGTEITILDPADTTIDLSVPAGVAADELLIACLAIEDDASASVVAPFGWGLLTLTPNGSKVTLGVWYKIAEASEPSSYQWSWSDSDNAIGWMVRVSNQHTTQPIASVTPATGTSVQPNSPSASSVDDYSLILRIGAFEKGDITVGDPGLSGHTPLLMEEANGDVSGGCGYRQLYAQGACGDTGFQLTNAKAYSTLTVIVSPIPE